MASWTEMILGIPFSSTVKVCQVICKIENCRNDLVSNVLYLWSLLFVGEVSNARRTANYNFSNENLGTVRTSRSKYVLYRRCFCRKSPDTLVEIIGSWDKGHAIRSFGVISVKVSFGSRVGLALVPKPCGSHVNARENRRHSWSDAVVTYKH